MKKLSAIVIAVLLLTFCAVAALALEPQDAACEHQWSEVYTSTEDGWHYATCTKCYEHGPLIACSGGTATCSARAKCDVCQGPHGNTLPHAYASGEWVSDASGHWRKCSNCNAEETDNIVAHTPVDNDCTTEDYCSKCNYKTADAQLNHNLKLGASNGASGHAMECTNGSCEHTENAPHAFDQEVASDTYVKDLATCTTVAVYYHSCVCGQKGTTTFSSGTELGHDFSNPAWVSNGTDHWKECSRCNDIASKAGHTPGDEATCVAAQTCTVCSWELNAKLEHSYTGAVVDNGNGNHSYKCVNGCGQYGNTTTCVDATGDNDHKCDTCGAADVSQHTPEADDGNCTTAVYCTECNAVTTAAKKEHAPGEAATCVAAQTCTVCSWELNAKLDHSYAGEVRANGDDTHSSKCVNGCGQYGNTVSCSGGTATCKDKAECDTCHQPYGELSTIHTPGQAATCEAAQTCTVCLKELNAKLDHSYTGSIKANGDDTHSYKCVNGCGQYGGTVGCSGGTATCGEKAVCAVCNTAYGSVDPSGHDFAKTLTRGESTHYYECNVCRARKDEAEHEYKNHISNGDDTHTGTCIMCGATGNGYCAGDDSAATCQKRATCLTCGEEYGTYAGHDYNKNVYAYKNPNGHAHVCKAPGCSAHDTLVPHTSSGAATEDTAEICTDCGYVIQAATGHVNHTPANQWSSDETHHWKECAGCTEQEFEKGAHVYDNTCDTTCNTCGHTREITHNFQIEHDAKEHWQECTVCGQEKANSRDEHSGGMASCNTKAVCTYCRAAYGTLDGSNHEKSTYHYDSNQDDTHRKEYDCCNAVISASEACTGGTATCQKKAVCDLCGGAYGELAPHDFDLTQWGYQTEDGHAHACKTEGCDAHDDVVPHTSSGAATEEKAEDCVDCGFVMTPALDHTTHSPKHEWESDDTHHWHGCEECPGQQLEKAEHIYDNGCDKDCNICGHVREVEHNYTELKHDDKEHWYECECGEEKPDSRVPHSGEICDGCGYEKDNQTAGSGRRFGCILFWILLILLLIGVGLWFFWFFILKKKEEEEEENPTEAPQNESE